MKNDTTTGRKIQHQIKRFSYKVTKGLTKPKKKFVSRMLFGIQASRDIKLSNIARGLNENIKLIKTENRPSRHIISKNKGIWTMDRGADRKILVGELGKMNLRFVIRSKGNRDVITLRGRTRKVSHILRTMKYNERYDVAIDKEGYTETIELHLARKDNLIVENTKVSFIAIKGFGKKPMLLMTNVDKSPKEILEIYLTRWKCEEAFRFLKHEYHLEDVRVRRYIALRNTVALIHAVFYFLSVYLGRALKIKILLNKILEKAKRFFQIPAFKHYAIADGIFRLLFNSKWRSGKAVDEDKSRKQLLFGFT